MVKACWISVGGIDPSIYFEDRRAYYCTNQTLHSGQEEVTLYEIDVESGAVIGEGRTLWTGIGGGHLEAPHVYHIGEWYFLLTAEGGTNFNHMVTVARSASLWGPYEGCPDNPILTNVHDTSKAVLCAGHGDLICDHYGNWWMVHLAIRLSRRTMSHLGRETFLMPVFWQDGWPKVGNGKKAALEYDGPLWFEQKTERSWQADFYCECWEPEWIFLRNPQKEVYKRGGGELKLYPTCTCFSDGKNPVFAAVRQFDFECEVDTAFSFTPCEKGDEAGLAIVLSSQFYYRFVKKRTEEGNCLVLEKNAEDMYQRACQIPVQDEKMYLKIRCDKEYYYFSYSTDGIRYYDIASASTRFLACEVAGRCFTGTIVGLYAGACQETNAVMCVETFEIKTIRV